MNFSKNYIINHAIGRSTRNFKRIWSEIERMQNEELACLAKKVRSHLPNVESFPIATIYTTIKEQEKTKLNLSDFKELIYHLTGWDISSQTIRRQLEINQISW